MVYLHSLFPPEVTSEHKMYVSMTKALKSKLLSSILIKLFLVGEGRQQRINIYNYCISSADEKDKSQKGYVVCQNHIIYSLFLCEQI